ncbi:unnamed protein product [Effrenium voratum]|nr:unnamed protein product [Effrenium voratum]
MRTELYKNLNPMIMDQEDADHLGATVVASCELFFEARKNQPADLAQWLAVEGLCSAAWEEKTRFNRSLKAGPREISLEIRQHLMRARVDARFKSSMARFTEKGWFRHAWVTFVAGNPSSPFVKMAEELIKSVHYFSSWPILVYNFGFAAPETWTPERFPQLVIIHAAPLPSDPHIRRSFNFNKLRSILMARVLTGVQVDVDQFVAPGADILFDLTQKWVNKEYPFPLLPAHFLDWSIKDQPNAPWWPRYCPDPEKPCPMQTMRWAHAHPTWSYWALPFFGRWVRRHFRDERLPNVTVQGFQAAALRVGDVMEDEDLLNVALWEERANKQWCKFDVPATVEFESLLSWKSSDGHRCIHGIGPGIGRRTMQSSQICRASESKEAFATMGLGRGLTEQMTWNRRNTFAPGQDIIVRRGDAFPVDAPKGPVYVCTRNDVLKDIIASVPEDRHEDLVFVQNGALMPFLDKELRAGLPITILLVYFAVAKKGEAPLDGKTDTDPEGLTAVNAGGKWAREVNWRLTSSDLACRILRKPHFTQAYWEKNLWIAAYMLVGSLHSCTVGEVESKHRAEVDEMITQLATVAASSAMHRRLARAPLQGERTMTFIV